MTDWRESATLDVEAAGAVLGVSRATAYALARNGEMPTIRLGRRILVPTAKLREMLGEFDHTQRPNRTHEEAVLTCPACAAQIPVTISCTAGG